MEMNCGDWLGQKLIKSRAVFKSADWVQVPEAKNKQYQ
jgi:hypothetical protein